MLKTLSHLCAPLVVLTSLLLHSGSTFAQTADKAPACPPATQVPSAEEAVQTQRAARDRGFLWRLHKDGRSSWLYGTLHVARFEWVFPGPRLAQALQQADAVALELDLLDPAIRQRLVSAPAHGSVVELPETLQQRLQRQIEAACLPQQALETLPPAMQAATLTVMAGRWDGLDPAWGIDPMLASLARNASKRVISLETPEQQTRALLGRSAAEHLQFVEQSLQDLELGRARPMLVRIAEVWSRGDLAEMERYEQWCDCMNSEAERALVRRLLDDRNVGLADGIDRLHRDGASVLAAVGSLHMIGPRGLPALMAARGYTVERVAFGP